MHVWPFLRCSRTIYLVTRAALLVLPIFAGTIKETTNEMIIYEPLEMMKQNDANENM